MIKRDAGGLSGVGMLFATMVFVSGCGDKALTTQPLTPTPIPTQGPSTVSMEVTLSRSNPPAGVKHAALATVMVRETGGRAVQLTYMTATSNDFNGTAIQVGGFSPMTLAAGQTVSFTVTLTTRSDISCSAGLALTIFTADQAPAFDSLGCEVVDWPF